MSWWFKYTSWAVWSIRKMTPIFIIDDVRRYSIFATTNLFIYTYKDAPIAGLQYLHYSWKLNFQFEFETGNQPGFEPGSPGPKVATLTIELHSIDYNNILWQLNTKSHQFAFLVHNHISGFKMQKFQFFNQKFGTCYDNKTELRPVSRLCCF